MFYKSILVVALTSCAVISFWSCVDIPGVGPGESALDMRAQIRFVHVGSGIDTIALALPAIGDTIPALTVTQSISTNGPDTILVTDSSFVTTYPSLYFRHFQVDYSQPLDVVEDGVGLGRLEFGGATAYLNTSAGPRDLELKGLGQILDTLMVQIADTHHVIHRDTLGRGSSHADTVIANRAYSIMPAAAGLGPETITIDYKNPKLIILTDRKASVFLIHDLQPVVALEGNRARYGWIDYMIADERYSDRIFRGVPSVPADSVAIRFINASRNVPSLRLTVRGPASTSVVSDSVAFLTVMRYRIYAEGQFSLSLSRAGSAVSVDSLSALSLTSHHRYSFVAVDSAATFKLRRYEDD